MADSTSNNDWDARAPEVLANPIRAYDAMRHQCPVAHDDYLHWSLFRHGDIMRVLHDHDTFSNAVSSHLSVPNGLDPPEHGRYRGIIEPYFSSAALARFEPTCRSIARNLVDALPDGDTVDLAEHFSRDFALRIQCAFMGWPESLHEPLRDWVRKNHEATLKQDRRALGEVATEFDDYIRELLDARRGKAPDNDPDVTTALMHEQIDGRYLTETELTSLLRNWTVGELGTIAASVSILLHYLARHPELREQLQAHTDELPAAIDEILRMDAPLMSNRRITTKEITLGGRRIPAGEQITILWGSANRDENVFGDPDAFRPQANAHNNLLYGAGIHVCPGAPLARMELRLLLEELLAQTRQLDIPADAQPQRALFPAGGFGYLPMRVYKRHG